MRNAFTMVELIFVIVIIGILSAVAIPKMNLISRQAKQSNIENFVAVLNATIGPTMWKKALKSDSGDVTAAECAKLIPDYLKELPKEVTAFGNDCSVTVDTAIADAGVVTFTNGNTIEVPSWSIDKTKYK